MNYKLLATVVGVGLIVGVVGRSVYDHIQNDRAKRLVHLFTELCLADDREDPETVGLIVLQETKGGTRWIDAKSKTLLNIRGRRCELSAFETNNLSLPDAQTIAASIGNIADRMFPALEFDEKAKRDSPNFERYWMHGAPQSQERWGIYLYSHLPGAEAGSSILAFHAPKNWP